MNVGNMELHMLMFHINQPFNLGGGGNQWENILVFFLRILILLNKFMMGALMLLDIFTPQLHSK